MGISAFYQFQMRLFNNCQFLLFEFIEKLKIGSNSTSELPRLQRLMRSICGQVDYARRIIIKQPH